jgi:hypothetical protein
MDELPAGHPRQRAWSSRSRLTIRLGMAVAVFICPNGVSAQTAPARPLLLGNVTLYPSLVFRDAGVDSNILLETNDPKEDFTFTVQPRVRAEVPFGSALLTGAATVGFVYYATYKSEQSINRLFEGRIQGTSGRLRPFAVVAFNQARERLGYEIQNRVDHQDLTLGGGAELKLTGITSLVGSYRHASQNYGEEQFLGPQLGTQLDHTSDVATAGARLAITPLTTISVDFELQRDRFDSGLRDSDSLRLMPAVEFAPDAMIAGRVAAGFRRFEPRDPRVEEFQGFVMSASAGTTLFGVTQLKIDAFRDVGYSFDPLIPTYLVTAAHLIVVQRLIGPVDLIGVGGRDELRYNAFEGLPAPVDRTWNLGGGVGFHLSPSLWFTVIYDVTERTSTERERRMYKQRRLFASATYGV